MLRVLLAKDLRRAWRNPWPYLIYLAVPLVITALLGLAFGGGKAKPAERIRFAIVDEDGSLVGNLLRSAAGQAEAARYLDPVFLPREEALRQVTNNQLSAALILPKGFTQAYLRGRGEAKLELVKNPAQSLHPALVEELSRSLVTGLNALSRNFHTELARWNTALAQSNRPAFSAIAAEISQAGTRLDSVRHLLFPPLVSLTSAATANEAARPGTENRNVGGKMFALLLPGLAAMFLMFLAEAAMRDFYREIRLHTLERLHTLPQSLFTFVLSKVLLTLVLLLIGAAILFGGGAALFQIHWTRPWALAGLVGAFGIFAAGFAALLAALAGAERRTEVINNLLVMLLGLASGCAFPPEALPPFLREQVTPWLPPNMLLATARQLQFEATTPAWAPVALMLAGLGLGLMSAAAWRFRRHLEKGLRG